MGRGRLQEVGDEVESGVGGGVGGFGKQTGHACSSPLVSASPYLVTHSILGAASPLP